jgi:hypothetical protein
MSHYVPLLGWTPVQKISKEGSQPTLGMSAVSTYFYITLRPLHDIQT